MFTMKTLWVRWSVASLTGLAVGIPAGIGAGMPLEAVVGMMLITPLMMGIGGSLLGASQWLVIRRLFAQSGWWIALSGVGLGLGLTAGVVTVEVGGAALTGGAVRFVDTGTGGLALSFGVIGLMGGLALGVAQALYLRRYVGGTLRWVLASAAGMTFGCLFAFLVAELVLPGVRTPVGAASFLVVVGLIAGTTTGKALESLTRAGTLSTY